MGTFYSVSYWMVPKRGRSTVILMQCLRFVDMEIVGLPDGFEHVVDKARLV